MLTLSHLSDAALIEQTRLCGDRQAFSTLLERHQAGALRMAQRMIAHEDTARELVQEAMLAAYLALDSLAQPERFQSWLYGIVINVCRSYLRHRHDDPLSIEALAGGLEATYVIQHSHAPDPQTMVEVRELHELVMAALESLSPPNREATLLYYYEQLSLREIGLMLGISMTAVKGRLHKSRRQLSKYFTTLAAYEPWFTPQRSSPVDSTIDERSQTMIEVQLVDVVLPETKPNEGDKDAQQSETVQTEKGGSSSQSNYVIVLLDAVGQRVLPIWVGPFEGHNIAIQLYNNNPVPRPLTYDFMANLLKVSGAVLEEIQISQLQEYTYYATAMLRIGETLHEIDARPSDAVALALRMKSRIVVAEEILEKAGKTLPEKYRGKVPGKGRDQFAARIEEMKQEHEATMAKFREAREKAQADEPDSAKEKLLTYIFGE